MKDSIVADAMHPGQSAAQTSGEEAVFWTQPAIRVAQVLGRCREGGVEHMVMNYYRHIDRAQVQFDFIMLGNDRTIYDDEILRLGGRVLKVPPFPHVIQSFCKYYTLFSKNRYAIVHAHLNTLNVSPLLAAKLAGVPVRISHNHSTGERGERKTMLKYLLRPFANLFPTHRFACSAHAGKWLFGEKRFRSGQISLIPNAIDIGQFLFDPVKRRQLRKRMGLEGKLVVGHVGRFVYQKNHVFLLDVFDELLQKEPGSVLLLIGEGPMETAVRGRVEALGLTDAVFFLGERKDVSDLLQAMDVFLFPSHYEGLGMALIEAQMAGLRAFASAGAVPDEAKLTDRLTFLDLCRPASEWAEEILKINLDDRMAASAKASRPYYDIFSAAKDLQAFYLRAYPHDCYPSAAYAVPDAGE